jgi:DNA-binding SARP family transcriptional activator
MAWLSLTLLGSFRARLEPGRLLSIPTLKGQALLAYLGLRQGQPEFRDKLAALLWPDTEDTQARHNLRQTLFALRRSLPRARPPALTVTNETVALNAVAVEVDVVAFERLIAEGTPAALDAAAARYQGDLLEGLAVAEATFEEWLRGERERLRCLALGALDRILAHHVRSGQVDTAVRTAVRLLALDPYQESVHRTLMRLYAGQGRRGLALHQYQLCVDVLLRDLGVEPEAATKQVYRELLPGGPGAGWAAPERTTASRASPRARTRSDLPSVDGALVGRERERKRLHRLLGEAWRGRGGTVVILGDAGIGKTHLVRELAVRVLRRRGQVLLGRSHDSEQALAFGPWVHALRGWLSAHPRALLGFDSVWRAELTRLLPELTAPGSSPFCDSDDHLRLFEAVARLIEHLASRRPLLLVLEDVHWADDMSLRLLSFLARRLAGCPVLMALTARSEEVPRSAALIRALEELDGDERLVTLSLSPLSREETALLVRDRAGPRAEGPARARLEERIWMLSEGNPFMIVEAMRAAHEGRGLETAGGLQLPERIREMVAGRLSRLSALGQDVVGVAALIGREFDFPILQRAAGLGAPRAAEGVEELILRRILHGSGEHLDFSHDRIREVSRDRLRPARRKALHARIANAIEELYAPDLAPHCAALGFHYRQGEVWDKAVPYLRQAGVQAMEQCAYREAAALFRETLSALPHLPPSSHTSELAVDLRLDLRRCLNPLGETPVILDYLREAEELAENIPDDSRLAGALIYLIHEFTLRAERVDALRCGERALGIGARLGDPSVEAAACYFIGETYLSAGDFRRGAEFFRRSIDATRGEPLPRRFHMTGLPSILSRAFLTLCLAALGELEAARGWADEAVKMAEAAAHPYSLAYALWSLGALLLTSGDLDEAIAVLERAHEICRARHFEQPYGVASLLGLALASRGRGAEGVPLVESAQRKVSACPGREVAVYLVRLADANLLCGRVVDGRRQAERALDLARASGERATEAYGLSVLAKAVGLADASELGRSEALHRDAMSRYAELGMRPALANCHLNLGRLYASARRLEEARAELGIALQLYRSVGAGARVAIAEQVLATVPHVRRSRDAEHRRELRLGPNGD